MSSVVFVFTFSSNNCIILNLRVLFVNALSYFPDAIDYSNITASALQSATNVSRLRIAIIMRVLVFRTPTLLSGFAATADASPNVIV